MIKFYIYSDIVESLIRLNKPAFSNKKFDTNPDPKSIGPYRIFNIGNSKPVKLEAIENKLGIKAKKNVTNAKVI